MAALVLSPARAQQLGPPRVISSTLPSSDVGQDGPVALARDGAGHWVAVWESNDSLGGTTGTDGDILVATSADDGFLWSAPRLIDPGAAVDSAVDQAPDVATDGAGLWIAVWGSLTGASSVLLLSRSTDNGATWSTPVPLHPGVNGWSPVIATDGAGTWVLAWASFGGSTGDDSDLFVSRSTDGGVTWSAPAALNTNAGTDSGQDWNVRIATDGAGTWVAAWTSNDDLGGTLSGDFDLLFARSTDGGATWSAPAALNTNAGTDSGQDWNARIATDGAGTWVATWESSDDLGGTIDNGFDALVARSADNGRTWSPPAPLDPNGASSTFGLDPVPQPVTGQEWVAVWRGPSPPGSSPADDQDIRIARSTDGGATWSPPQPLNEGATSDTAHDGQPQIFPGPGPHWLVVWVSSDTYGSPYGSDDDIFVAHSTDGGTTWSAPQPLNSNAAADPWDRTPELATDGAGTWVAVWRSYDSLGGTIGSEHSLLPLHGHRGHVEPARAAQLVRRQ